ncbi:MAG: hypothetical protein AAF709_22075, partial [Pseudomonadota bacterium]
MFRRFYEGREAKRGAAAEHNPVTDRQDEVVLRTAGYLTGARSMTSTVDARPQSFRETAMVLRGEIGEVMRDARTHASPMPAPVQTLLKQTYAALDGALKKPDNEGSAQFGAFAQANKDAAINVVGLGENDGYIARYEREELGEAATTE